MFLESAIAGAEGARFHWSKAYGEAVHESQRTVQMVRTNIAVTELLRSTLEMGTNAERRGEQKEILCALNDLRIMIHLHKKYASSGLTLSSHLPESE